MDQCLTRIAVNHVSSIELAKSKDHKLYSELHHYRFAYANQTHLFCKTTVDIWRLTVSFLFG